MSPIYEPYTAALSASICEKYRRVQHAGVEKTVGHACMTKKYIIIKPNCRELANHLWNYISIYAYGLETGAPVYNPSFFEWHRYFNLSGGKLRIPKIFLSLYGSYLVRMRASCVLLTISEVTYLPPTRPLVVRKSPCDTTYFIGWLFRNPLGLEKYRSEIVSAFAPKKHILKKIEDALAPFRGKKLIGIHLRQQPYKGFEDGSFLVPPARVRAIVDEYLREQKLTIEDVELITVSDEYDVTNLFLLSRCSVVIGTNSTFSNLAAWFGNIPHIVTTNDPVNWEYYRDKATYFENKYATFAQ